MTELGTMLESSQDQIVAPTAATLGRLRVLLLAYQCNPHNTSEPRVGFEWARHLQHLVDLTVLTHERNASAITTNGELKCRVVYVPAERLSRPIWRVNEKLFGATHVQPKMLLGSLDYLAYEYLAGRLMGPNHIRRDFDLVHRVSPKCLWWPSFSVPPEMPYVIGPLNSGMDWPPALHTAYGSRLDPWVNRARRAAYSIAVARLSPWRRLLIGNRVCQFTLPGKLRSQSAVVMETAFDDAPHLPPRVPRSGPLRLLFVGRLIPLKGVDLLLRAVAACTDLDMHLTVVGAGPQRAQLESLSGRLQLAHMVTFTGPLPRDEVKKRYRQSDVMVFPSLRESGGNVVYEALASELPVIAVDHGGPAELVTPACGILIPPGGTDEIVRGLANAIHSLAHDEPRRARMATAAREHLLARHTWPARAHEVLNIYADVLAARRR